MSAGLGGRISLSSVVAEQSELTLTLDFFVFMSILCSGGSPWNLRCVFCCAAMWCRTLCGPVFVVGHVVGTCHLVVVSFGWENSA